MIKKKAYPVLSSFIFLLVMGIQGCNSPDSQNGHSHTHSHEGEPGEHPTAYPDRIIATWNDNPATTLSVTWRTSSGVVDAEAHIAPAKPAPKFYRHANTLGSKVTKLTPDKVEGETVAANYHSVTFKDLQPNTLYAYKVGHEGHWSEWFQIRTAKQKQAPFNFIYVGDAQNGILSHWSRAIRAAYAEQPDASFIIHAGDLVNNAHRNVEWGRWNHAGGFIQSMIPSIAIPGNHEYQGYSENQDEESLSIHWRPQFEFPMNGPEGLKESVYYLDYQGMRIIGLNTNEQIEKQTQWLEDVLQDNPNRWTVVTHHHPVFASADGRDNETLRNKWQPLYNEYGVDLVMQGHDHTYARGQAKNIKGGVNTRDPESGTVYVNSVSGAKMYDVQEDRWDPFNANMQRAAENTQLFQLVRVRHDTLKYRAYTVTGELYDAFGLVQQSGQLSNQMIERTVEIKEERTHDNTIPYQLESDN